MLDKLIETGKLFEKEFTIASDFTDEIYISTQKESEYMQWISRVGVFVEATYNKLYPQMTKAVVDIVRNKSVESKDYNIIIGYLESSKELGF